MPAKKTAKKPAKKPAKKATAKKSTVKKSVAKKSAKKVVKKTKKLPAVVQQSVPVVPVAPVVTNGVVTMTPIPDDVAN